MNNPAVCLEIGWRNRTATSQFYRDLFDWPITHSGSASEMAAVPIPIPTGTFAWFADPEGRQVGLIQPAA